MEAAATEAVVKSNSSKGNIEVTLMQESSVPQHTRQMEKFTHEPDDGIVEITASKTPSMSTGHQKEQEYIVENMTSDLLYDHEIRHTRQGKKSRHIITSKAPIYIPEYDALDKEVWEKMDADLNGILDTEKFGPKFDNEELRKKSDRLIQELKDKLPHPHSDECSTSDDESRPQSSECLKTSKTWQKRTTSDRLIREMVRTLSHNEFDTYINSDTQLRETDNEQTESDIEPDNLSHTSFKALSSGQQCKSSFSSEFKSHSDTDMEAGVLQKHTDRQHSNNARNDVRQHSNNARNNQRCKRNSSRYRLVQCVLVPSSSSDENQPKSLCKPNNLQSQLHWVENDSQQSDENTIDILEKESKSARTSPTKQPRKTPFYVCKTRSDREPESDLAHQHTFSQHFDTGVKDGQLESCIKVMCSHKSLKLHKDSRRQRPRVALPSSSSYEYQPSLGRKLSNSQSQLSQMQHAGEPPDGDTGLLDAKSEQQRKNSAFSFRAHSDNEAEPGIVQNYIYDHQPNFAVGDRQLKSGTKKHLHKKGIRLLRKHKNSYRLKQCVSVPSSSSDEYQPRPEGNQKNSLSQPFQMTRYSHVLGDVRDEKPRDTNQQHCDDTETGLIKKYPDGHQFNFVMKTGQPECVTKQRCPIKHFKLHRRNKHSFRLKQCIALPSSSSDEYQPKPWSNLKSFQLHQVHKYSQKPGHCTTDVTDEKKIGDVQIAKMQQQSEILSSILKPHCSTDVESTLTHKNMCSQHSQKEDQMQSDRKEQCSDNSSKPQRNSALSYGLNVYTLYPPLSSNDYQQESVDNTVDISVEKKTENVSKPELQLQSINSSSCINNDTEADHTLEHRSNQWSDTAVQDRSSESKSDVFFTLCKHSTQPQSTGINCTVLPSSNSDEYNFKSNTPSPRGLKENCSQEPGTISSKNQTKNSINSENHQQSKTQAKRIRCTILSALRLDKLRELGDGAVNLPERHDENTTRSSIQQQQSEHSPLQSCLKDCHVKDQDMKSDGLLERDETSREDKMAACDPDKQEEHAVCLDEFHCQHNNIKSDSLLHRHNDTRQQSQEDQEEGHTASFTM